MPSQQDLRLARQTPVGTANLCTQNRFACPPHIELIQRELMECVAGRTKRLMVTLPPRHGKSECVSHWFPVWLLGNFPQMRIMLCSYEASFAASWSRKIRDSLTEAVSLQLYKCGPRADLARADQWETVLGGGVVSAGVGGAITGRGANALIIDDPVKNAEEAHSPTYRQKTWDWYTTTAYTRLEPVGFVVLVMTRWDIDDLGGRILSPDYQAQADIDQWRRIDIPAIAEEDDPLGREPGAALWPDRYPIETLEQQRRVLGTYAFSALYQQRPTLAEGGMFKRQWMRFVDAEPAIGRDIRFWDLAGTEGAGDWTAGVKVREFQKRYVVTDVVHGQLSPQGVRNLILATAELDGKECSIGMYQDPGQAGKAQAQEYAKLLAGYPFHIMPSSGDPDLRAMAVAAQFEAENIEIKRGPWNGAFVDELCAFQSKRTNGVDDQVDALSGAFGQLTTGFGEIYVSSLY